MKFIESSTTISKESSSELTNQNETVRVRTGIYKITNIITNKIYIGSAMNIYERYINHISMLRNNSHHSIHLQRAFNKYGENNFTFEIIEQCEENELISREQYYLNTLLFAQEFIKNGDKRFIKLGYNIKPSAGSNKGYKMTDEQIFNILEKHGRRIYAIDVNGNIVKEFISIKYAKEYFSLNSSGPILLSCKTRQLTKVLPQIGFLYKDDYYEGYIPNKITLSRKNNLNYTGETLKKPIHVYTTTGDFIETFSSHSECANKYNINPANLQRKINKINKKRMRNSKTLDLIFLNDKGKYIAQKLRTKI